MRITNGLAIGVVAPALLLTPVAGCGRPEPATPKPPPAAPPQSRAEAEAAPFYVGRWAAKLEMCADAAWVITRREISTPGEVHCRLGEAAGAGPVEVEATCTAEGPPKPWRLRFAYAQSARALLVENGPFADIGLVRCPGA